MWNQENYVCIPGLLQLMKIKTKTKTSSEKIILLTEIKMKHEK